MPRRIPRLESDVRTVTYVTGPRTGNRATSLAAVAVAGLALTVFSGSAAYAVPLTPHHMPFPCGQTWTGSTRGSHTPSIKSIDWNRADDVDDPVVASAPGVVTTADSTSTRSYGHHVVIDHQNGESTVYGHLNAVTVTLGQRVDQGTMIGTVGNTGNSRGAHLHFEEKIGRTVTAASFGAVPYVYGNLTSFNCVDVPIAGNFVGDAISEVAVYRRGKRSSFVVNDPAGARVLTFGATTDEPVIGDWDGDGAVNLGIRRPKKSKFRLKTPSRVIKIAYGEPSDRPIAGDWDGNGTSEIGVFRPSTATFHQRLADGSTLAVVLGDSDDIPVTGDWDGDKVTDLGVYDQTTAVFTLRLVDSLGLPATTQVPLGLTGDLPVTGDWDGNGTTDLGAWSPATATFVQAHAIAPTATRTAVTDVRFGLPRR